MWLLFDIEQGIHDDLYVGMHLIQEMASFCTWIMRAICWKRIALPGSNGTYEWVWMWRRMAALWVTQRTSDAKFTTSMRRATCWRPFAFSPEYPIDVAVRSDGQVFVTSGISGGVWQLDPATGDVTLFADVNSALG